MLYVCNTLLQNIDITKYLNFPFSSVIFSKIGSFLKIILATPHEYMIHSPAMCMILCCFEILYSHLSIITANLVRSLTVYIYICMKRRRGVFVTFLSSLSFAIFLYCDTLFSSIHPCPPNMRYSLLY